MKASIANANAKTARSKKKRDEERELREYRQEEHAKEERHKAEMAKWWQNEGWDDIQKSIKGASEKGDSGCCCHGVPKVVIKRLRKDGYKVETGRMYKTSWVSGWQGVAEQFYDPCEDCISISW